MNDFQIRKYVQIKMFNKNIKFQLDTGTDGDLINTYIGKKLINPLYFSQGKSRVVWQDKLLFVGEVFFSNVNFNG